MNIKFIIIIIMFGLTSCVTKHTNMEICFEHIQHRIKPDSVLEKLKYCPVDSCSLSLALIHKIIVEDSKSDSICPESVQRYFSENDTNSNTVNNIILFQQFQAYLKHQKFNQSRARETALHVEIKWRKGK